MALQEDAAVELPKALCVDTQRHQDLLFVQSLVLRDPAPLDPNTHVSKWCQLQVATELAWQTDVEPGVGKNWEKKKIKLSSEIGYIKKDELIIFMSWDPSSIGVDYTGSPPVFGKKNIIMAITWLFSML